MGEAIKSAGYDPLLMGENAQGVDHLAKANAELAADDNLWKAMKEQARSMLGMAGMFVITIMLAVILQPFYDFAGMQAFGEAGATQVRFIMLELVAILLFTVLIIALARWKKEWIIKYGILFIIFIALSYSTVPLAHYIIAPTEDPTSLQWAAEDTGEERIVDFIGPNEYITSTQVENENNTGLIFTISKHTDTGNNSDWTGVYHESSFLSGQVYMGIDDTFGFTEGESFWFVNPETGEKISDDNRSCSSMMQGPECRMMFTFGQYNQVHTVNVDGNIHRFHPTLNSSDGQWQLSPLLDMRDGYISARVVDENKLLIVTTSQVVFAEIPTETAQLGNDRVMNEVEHIWNFTMEEGTSVTASDWGFSPRSSVTNENNTGDEMFLLLGTSEGDVFGFEFNLTGSGDVTAADWMKLDGNDAIEGEVDAVRLADYNFGGINDVFVIDDNGLKMFSGYSLLLRLEDSSTTGSHIMIVDDASSDTTTLIEVKGREGADGWSQATFGEANLVQPFSTDDTAWLVGILVSVLLMIMLWKHPEWYVVNTVGILVGGGVITMLGISFVPWLIIIFMVLAAAYDAWAVYRSKHMLELADTMIGLNLPILLVAPQDSDYSFLDEDDDRMRSAAETDVSEAAAGAEGFKAKSAASKVKKPAKKSKEAMFMGLGDVIFPGMLVISAMTYLAPIGGANAALGVGMGTMIGGLVGYFVLMTYVARGRPQAGLPLLNGGAILGYIISALLLIGTKALELNFTF